MLGAKLKQIRQEMGHKSGRSFFHYLESKTQLEFNYSYYARIEAGKVLPSPKIIQALASLLDASNADDLVLAYCQSMFPKRKYLFHFHYGPIKKDQASPIKKIESADFANQQILSIEQVLVLAKSKLHWFLSTLIVLARRPLRLSQLTQALPQYSLEKIEEAIAELTDNQLAQQGPEGISSLYKEMGFPPKDTPGLADINQKLDRWDQEFAQQFQFDNYQEKNIIRRISPRYFNMINTHCQLLMELILSSEEAQVNLNDEVISFDLKLSKGILPG